MIINCFRFITRIHLILFFYKKQVSEKLVFCWDYMNDTFLQYFWDLCFYQEPLFLKYLRCIWMKILTKYFHERNLFGKKTYSLLTSFHGEHPMENTQATFRSQRYENTFQEETKKNKKSLRRKQVPARTELKATFDMKTPNDIKKACFFTVRMTFTKLFPTIKFFSGCNQNSLRRRTTITKFIIGEKKNQS